MEDAVELMRLLQAEDIALDLPAANKDEVLAAVSERLARRIGVDPAVVLDALAEREALGSTAMGQGIAIPHAGVEGASGPAAALVRLRDPVEFDATDGGPVDLVFAATWPGRTGDGLLTLLAQICRAFREPRLARRMREAATPEEAWALLRLAAEPQADVARRA